MGEEEPERTVGRCHQWSDAITLQKLQVPLLILYIRGHHSRDEFPIGAAQLDADSQETLGAAHQVRWMTVSTPFSSCT